MNRQYKEYTIMNAVTPVAVTSSTDATPIVVTATSHGFATGDLVFIYGHTTNTAANGVFKVTKVNANSFSLQDFNSGSDIAGSGAGAGASGLCCVAPKIPLVSDFLNAEFSVITSGTATLTLNILGSVGKLNGDSPNFGATVSASNPYEFLGSYDVDTGTFYDGSTGIATTATDLNKLFKVNTSGQKYLTIVPTAWTQGAITTKLMLFSN